MRLFMAYYYIFSTYIECLSSLNVYHGQSTYFLVDNTQTYDTYILS